MSPACGRTAGRGLALWSGLGYYSRARNLHRCAQAVVEDWGGAFPGRAEDLGHAARHRPVHGGRHRLLLLSERVPILDANVRRVLTRVLAFDADLAVAKNERELWDLGRAAVPHRGPAAAMPRYTQA